MKREPEIIQALICFLIAAMLLCVISSNSVKYHQLQMEIAHEQADSYRLDREIRMQLLELREIRNALLHHESNYER